jgi:hypothetical protein
MQATGKPIDLHRTLGENLAMHGEGFGDAPATGGGMNGQAQQPFPVSQAQQPFPVSQAQQPLPSGVQGPVAPQFQGPTAPQFQGPVAPQFQGPEQPAGTPKAVAGVDKAKKDWRDLLAASMAGFGKGIDQLGTQQSSRPSFAVQSSPSLSLAPTPSIDPGAASSQRDMMAQAIARLNSGKLYG